MSPRLLRILLPKGTHQPSGVGRDLHALGPAPGKQTGPAGSRCPIQLIQAGAVAGAISQECNEASDRAGGALSMELQ